jgi:hypothetical protein
MHVAKAVRRTTSTLIEFWFGLLFTREIHAAHGFSVLCSVTCGFGALGFYRLEIVVIIIVELGGGGWFFNLDHQTLVIVETYRCAIRGCHGGPLEIAIRVVFIAFFVGIRG